MSDLIDRQTAIDAIYSCHVNGKNTRKICQKIGHTDAFSEGILDAVDAVECVPSAQPERKMGKWIGMEFGSYADGYPVFYEWKCSECGVVFEDEEPTWNFCPECGADMRGEQNE